MNKHYQTKSTKNQERINKQKRSNKYEQYPKINTINQTIESAMFKKVTNMKSHQQGTMRINNASTHDQTSIRKGTTQGHHTKVKQGSNKGTGGVG